MIHEGDCGAIGRMKIGRGKPKYSEKTCPSATLFTTNPTLPDPGLNPGRRGGKPATNRFSYGAACVEVLEIALDFFGILSRFVRVFSKAFIIFFPLSSMSDILFGK
jgi:hypothetical protein